MRYVKFFKLKFLEKIILSYDLSSIPVTYLKKKNL